MRVGEEMLFEEERKMKINSDAQNLGQRIVMRSGERSLESEGTSDELKYILWM